MKAYIEYTLRRYLPYFLTLGIVLVAYFMICVNASNACLRISGLYINGRPTSSMLGFFIPLIILTTFAPLFANRYRYHIQDVDLFYQNPKGQRAVRYTNNLVVLLGSIAIYTVLFLFSLFIMLLIQLPDVGKEIVRNQTTYRYILFNFGYYILAYLIVLVASCFNYFIAYFLITRSNRPINSLIMLACGYFLLHNLIATPLYYAFYYYSQLNGDVWYIFRLTSFSTFHSVTMINPLALAYEAFNPLVIGVDSSFFETRELILVILDFIHLGLFVFLGGLCIFAFIKEKESSGELAGKSVGRDYYQNIIFEASFILLAFLLGAIGNYGSVLQIVLQVAILVFLLAGYYVFRSIMNHRFAIKKKDIIHYVIVSATYIVSLVLTIVLNTIINSAN